MTFDPCRRKGKGVAGARARQGPAGLHEGARRDFLRRHELEAAAVAQGTAAARKAFLATLLPRAADSRNLRLAWDHLAADGGQAPGLDGLRCDHLEDHEVWGLVRTLGRAILDGTYRPAPDRKVQIPKASGKGTRTLSIPSVVDRVAQRAVVQVVQPYADVFFDEHSLGYRPGSHVYQALALAEGLIVKDGRWVLLAEDLKDAFDAVPQQRLLDVIRTYLPDEGMVRPMARVC
jgi:retron-type reverse transcriptase